MAFNGVCGNLGAALAAGITAGLISWFGWRGAFVAPGLICIATGVAFLALVPEEKIQAGGRKNTAQVTFALPVIIAMFSLYVVISLAGGLIFNSVSVALPKIVDERIGQTISLSTVGWLATGVFLCGAVAQLVMGRLIERYSPPILFAAVVTLQFVGILWAAYSTGIVMMFALALTMAMIYAQVTAGDIVIARYTADAWRGRVYAVRYFLTFTTSAAAVSALALLHARGGFDLVLMALAAVAAVLVLSVQAFVFIAMGAERRQREAFAPAE